MIDVYFVKNRFLILFSFIFVLSFAAIYLFVCFKILKKKSLFSISCLFSSSCLCPCLAGSPSRGGDVVVNVKDINQPSLPTPFHSVLVSISLFMALSTVFQSINSADNCPLFHSVLPVLILPYWSFQLYISF